MNYLLQVDAAKCIDCVTTTQIENLPELLTCLVTIGVAAIIRAIEKRKIKRANRKDV